MLLTHNDRDDDVFWFSLVHDMQIWRDNLYTNGLDCFIDSFICDNACAKFNIRSYKFANIIIYGK